MRRDKNETLREAMQDLIIEKRHFRFVLRQEIRRGLTPVIEKLNHFIERILSRSR